MRSRPIVLISALVGVATLLTTPAHAGGPSGTPVTACGTVVTGDAYLANDLSCGDGTAVTLSGAARLDLRGHTVGGQGDHVGAGRVLRRHRRCRGAQRSDHRLLPRRLRLRQRYQDGEERDHRQLLERSGRPRRPVRLNPAVVRIDRSRLESNLTGISMGYFNRVEITKTVVADNNWGADLAWSGAAVISKSTFQDNVVGLLCSDDTTCDITASTFTGQQDEGIFQYASDVRVSGSTFSQNGAGWGGAFGHTSITGSTFTSNTVGVRSGLGHALDSSGAPSATTPRGTRARPRTRPSTR